MGMISAFLNLGRIVRLTVKTEMVVAYASRTAWTLLRASVFKGCCSVGRVRAGLRNKLVRAMERLNNILETKRQVWTCKVSNEKLYTQVTRSKCRFLNEVENCIVRLSREVGLDVTPRVSSLHVQLPIHDHIGQPQLPSQECDMITALIQ